MHFHTEGKKERSERVGKTNRKEKEEGWGDLLYYKRTLLLLGKE